jgi:syntaxin 7
MLNNKLHKTQLAYISEEEEEDDEIDYLQPGTSTSFMQQEQKQQYMPIDPNFEINLMLEQEQTINEIESDVQELSQMMGKLSELVVVQSEPINKIEEHVTHTEISVQEATVELKKASSYMQKSRKKLMIIVIILSILGFIVISIIYSKFK